jgi:2-succinyl-6-hydroxy-2,4-cyclohexadiene-1-carboxylate synthase
LPIVNVNDVRINVEMCRGPLHAPTLVLLHGFTGSAATWAPHMIAWRDTCTTIAIDALGHGASDAPEYPQRYALPHAAMDIVAVLDHVNIERCVLLGYSMGGRVALQTAIAAPDRIAALALESASPGLRTAKERAARVEADERLAQHLERDGIAAFVDMWEQLPLWASRQRLPEATRLAERTQRLRNNPHGLAQSLRGAGTGTQAPLHDYLKEIRIPVLLIAGEQDAKFCAIAREMHAALPNAQPAIIPGVGHTVHLEAPNTFDSLVSDFVLDTVARRSDDTVTR